MTVSERFKAIQKILKRVKNSEWLGDWTSTNVHAIHDQRSEMFAKLSSSTRLKNEIIIVKCVKTRKLKRSILIYSQDSF